MGRRFITGDSTGEKSPSQNTPVLVSRVDCACAESSCPDTSQRVPVASRNGSTHLEMSRRDRCIRGAVSPSSPRFLLAWIVIPTHGTWKSRMEMLPGWGGVEWFGFLSRWQHEIRDVTGGDTAAKQLLRDPCCLTKGICPVLQGRRRQGCCSSSQGIYGSQTAGGEEEGGGQRGRQQQQGEKGGFEGS